MSKVIIDYGHVDNDTGAVANGFREDFLNKSIGGYAVDELKRHGVDVVVTTGSLEHRVQVENAVHPDLFVSIHNNSGGGDGTEVLKYDGSEKGQELAKNILDEVVKANLNNSRGLKNRNDLYVLRKTTSPAALIECAFMDTNDIQAVDTEEERKAFGVAIAKGILRTLGISYKLIETPKEHGGWRVCIGYYEQYNNAIEAVDKAKTAGFNAYMVPFMK